MRTRMIAARNRHGLTQEQLAAAIKHDQSTVSRIERGLNVPSGDVLLQLCTVLRLKPADVLFVEPDTEATDSIPHEAA